ncbi:MAG: hypothetical protein LBV30_04235 [Propionibacteriaceae bacterium]|jgi:plasmid stability protein|nr:hypothetical protein [Propionibacteriaceae bacterium]
MAATITVRNLSEDTQRVLRHRAIDHNQSFEAEVRQILTEAAQASSSTATPAATIFAAADQFRKATSGLGFTLPPRLDETQRDVNL